MLTVAHCAVGCQSVIAERSEHVAGVAEYALCLVACCATHPCKLKESSDVLHVSGYSLEECQLVDALYGCHFLFCIVSFESFHCAVLSIAEEHELHTVETEHRLEF